MSRKVTRVMIDGKIALYNQDGITVKFWAGIKDNSRAFHVLDNEGVFMAVLPIDKEVYFLTDEEFEPIKNTNAMLLDMIAVK